MASKKRCVYWRWDTKSCGLCHKAHGIYGPYAKLFTK